MFRLVFKMYCSKLFIKFFSRYDPLPNHLEFLHPLKIVSNFYFIYKGSMPDPVFWGIFWSSFWYLELKIWIPEKGFLFFSFFLTKSNTFSLVIQYVFEMCLGVFLYTCTNTIIYCEFEFCGLQLMVLQMLVVILQCMHAVCFHEPVRLVILTNQDKSASMLFTVVFDTLKDWHHVLLSVLRMVVTLEYCIFLVEYIFLSILSIHRQWKTSFLLVYQAHQFSPHRHSVTGLLKKFKETESVMDCK